MKALQTTALRQAAWSITANQLKQTLDRVRWTTFGLSILGAMLATAASQLPDTEARKAVAIAGAVMLAIATFLTARLATPGHVSGWVRARAAAEALKREGFKTAAQAAPYDDPATADERLTKERQAIENGAEELADRLVEASKAGSVPVAAITPAEYLEQRVQAQLKFYRPKAEQARQMAARLRGAEFVLALLATVVTALVGVLGKTVAGLPFDLAALTAILTTLGATLLSHLEASRYDEIVRTYRAAARRLEDARDELKTVPAAPSPEWSAFVERCEGIIAAENSSWAAKREGKT